MAEKVLSETEYHTEWEARHQAAYRALETKQRAEQTALNLKHEAQWSRLYRKYYGHKEELK